MMYDEPVTNNVKGTDILMKTPDVRPATKRTRNPSR